MAVDLNSKMTGLSPLGKADGVRPSNAPDLGAGKVGDGTAGAEFKRALEQIAGQMPQPAKGTNPTAGAEKLKFSSHAVDRMRSRGISIQPDMMKNIENAIGRAAAKGAKDTLVLAGDNALIVSVKNNTVVTVMDRAAMKDNVFTNIDSTVVV